MRIIGKLRETIRKMSKVREIKRKNSESKVSGLWGPWPKIEIF